MILKVPFTKKRLFGKGVVLKTKEVEILINLGALELAAERVGKDLWEIGEYIVNRENNTVFMSHLLLAGYQMACTKNGVLPKYELKHAAIWVQILGKEEEYKFNDELINLFGKLQKTDDKKKVM